MNVLKTLSISLLFLNFACNNIEKLDTTKVKEKVEASKIKRITPAQLNMQVEKWGGGMSKVLTAQLEKEITGASKTRLEEICHLKNIKLIDSLSVTYKINIRLLGMPDSTNKTLFEKEREVLEAYIDNAKKKLLMVNNVQKIGDSLFVYTYPVTSSKVISKLCFADETTNFALWSIVFRKREIIRKTNLKDLK